MKDIAHVKLWPPGPTVNFENSEIFLDLSNVLDEVTKVSSVSFSANQWMLTSPTFT